MSSARLKNDFLKIIEQNLVARLLRCNILGHTWCREYHMEERRLRRRLRREAQILPQESVSYYYFSVNIGSILRDLAPEPFFQLEDQAIGFAVPRAQNPANEAFKVDDLNKNCIMDATVSTSLLDWPRLFPYLPSWP